MFQLHPQLAADCLTLGSLPLCRLLLLKDANYPWCVLVPERADIREIHQLTEPDQQQLMRESVLLARAMEQVFTPHKMNVAALGNLVPQLHIHHIARYPDDPAWPAPVWGRVPALAYEAGELEVVAQRLTAALPAGASFRAAAD